MHVLRTLAPGAALALCAAGVMSLHAPSIAHADDAAPARLRVERDPDAPPRRGRVALRVLGCEGAPRLTASVGSVPSVAVVAPGHATADYHLPREARPQVAIVTAACGGRHGWTALPVVGRGVAIAQTKPGAEIVVTIGPRSFGPVTAGPDGRAEVPVEVPPGVRFAYHGERPLDLRVPPSPHVHAVLEPREVRADREEVVRVRLFAVTDGGAPRDGAPLRLVVTEGTVTDPQEVEPGASVATWTLPPGPASLALLEARLEDDPGPGARAGLERQPGPPARIEVEPDRAAATAGEGSVTLDVRVLDAVGNPTAADLRIGPPAGSATELGTGRFAVVVPVPERLEGRSALEVSLGAGDALAAVEVPLTAAPAVDLAVEASDDELVADGRSRLALRVALSDRFGNPALAVPPETTTEGPAEISTTREGDAFLVTVRPRRRLAPGDETVTLTGAGRTEQLRVGLRAPPSLVSVAARGGFLASTGGLRSPFASAEAALWPVGWGGLGLGLEAGAFVLDRDDDVAVGEAGVSLRGRSTYLPLVLAARWRAALRGLAVLHAGAGPALAPVSVALGVRGQPETTEQGIAAGAQVAFGAGRRLGAGTLFLEARALWLSHGGLEALRGELFATGLVAGWSHAMF